jgi:hypothetical protein
MLSLRIEVWNQPAYTTASEPTPDTNKVFDQLIEDQEMAAELERQFNDLPRGTHGGSVMTHGYRYQFTFFHDRVVTQTYEGVSFSNTWVVYNYGDKETREGVVHPRSLVASLHERVGLPVRK